MMMLQLLSLFSSKSQSHSFPSKCINIESCLLSPVPAAPCFQVPDGFVTPLRSTPHRHLTTTPVSEAAQIRSGASAAARTSSRMSRVSRQLRGPFGQMLMEEMAKSDKAKDQDHLQPSYQEDQSPPTVISHQRTRSSPSKLMDFSQEQFNQASSAPEAEHSFATLSRDKLTVAQELLVPRTSGSSVMSNPALVSHYNNEPFRRPKVSLISSYFLLNVNHWCCPMILLTRRTLRFAPLA